MTPTCYSPGQIIGVLNLRFLVLNKADLTVAVATTRRRRGRQKLKFFIFLDKIISIFSYDKVGVSGTVQLTRSHEQNCLNVSFNEHCAVQADV